MAQTRSADPYDAPEEIPVRLLLLLDSRSPAGAHSHSGGMEAAVTAGFVTDVDDVEAFCRGRLHTSAQVAAGFAAAACRGWLAGWSAPQWARLDQELSARTPSPAARRASRALGSGLRRLLLATEVDLDVAAPWAQCPPPPPHQPLVLGAGCAVLGGSPQLAARAAAQSTCTAAASAAVRLLGLDPYRIHGMLASLGSEIEALADAASLPGAPLPAGSAPALELLADVHADRRERLFAS